MYPNTTTLTERYIAMQHAMRCDDGTGKRLFVPYLSELLAPGWHDDADLCQGCQGEWVIGLARYNLAASMPTELALNYHTFRLRIQF